MQRLSTNKRGQVGIFTVNQRHESQCCQFGLAAVTDGDFGWTFHIHAAVIRRECVAGKVFNDTAGLNATDRGTPTIIFK